LAPVLSAGKSATVLAATAAEVAAIHARAERVYGERALAVSADGDAEITGRWEQAQAPGHLVIGTPRLALWQVADLSLTVVLEEGRRAMKDRQTPTIHVRDLTRTRSRVEGFNTVFLGPTPSVELLAAGAAVVPAARRPWGLVEVVDRSGERPGSSLLSDQVIAALRATVADAGENAFILTGHRTAPTLVDEINTRVGAGAAAVYPGNSMVMVGTERDLAGLEPVSLVVAANVDALLMGTGYRAAEEALRQLARLANMLRAGRGRRMMIQTESPGSDLVQTLRRGNPIPYLERVLVDRARAGLPPSTEMIAIEVRGDSPQGVEDEIAGLGASEVFGPMAIDDGRRWLLSGSLTKVRKDLREHAGRWRERGATIRIDADPIDF
jgi:primosomal protein N'